MVDVTHDGHDRRTDDQVVLVALVLTELEVEGLEQLAVLVLGGDDLDDVVELLAEQLERLGVDRLGRRHHLAEREQHLHQRGGVDADLLGEVGQGRTAGQANGLAVALADAHATDRRRLHLLELLTTSALRLATATRRTAGATEGALGLATATAALARTATAAGTEATAGATATGSTATGSTGTGAAGSTGTPPGGTRPGAGAATGPPGPPPGPPAGPPPKAAGDLGIIAGLGRGMPGRPSPRRPADAADAGRLRRPRARGRGPDGVPCPGSRRTGCCPDAARRAGRRAGVRVRGLGARGRSAASESCRTASPWPGRGSASAAAGAAAAAGASDVGVVRGPGLGPGAAGGRLGGRGLDGRCCRLGSAAAAAHRRLGRGLGGRLRPRGFAAGLAGSRRASRWPWRPAARRRTAS